MEIAQVHATLAVHHVEVRVKVPEVLVEVHVEMDVFPDVQYVHHVHPIVTVVAAVVVKDRVLDLALEHVMVVQVHVPEHVRGVKVAVAHAQVHVHHVLDVMDAVDVVEHVLIVALDHAVDVADVHHVPGVVGLVAPMDVLDLVQDAKIHVVIHVTLVVLQRVIRIAQAHALAR